MSAFTIPTAYRRCNELTTTVIQSSMIYNLFVILEKSVAVQC